MGIPSDLMDSARIDGCSEFRIFFNIVLPISKPALGAAGIFVFQNVWNQYLWPLVVTTQTKMDTIVMGMQQLAQVANTIPQWNDIMAMAILAMLPPVVVIIVMQRLFVKGLIETEK